MTAFEQELRRSVTNLQVEHYKPPLRLVLNSSCNGHCSFCHNEGRLLSTIMSVDTVFSFIESAYKLGIQKVALTGGEPTLRSDLPDIINEIQKEYPNIQLSLTTNGLNLSEVGKALHAPIDKINLSITSLNDELAGKYQNVNPLAAIDSLICFPAIKKNINIVMLDANYTELEDFLKISMAKHISLDILFGSITDKRIEQYVFNRISDIGDAFVEGSTTPTLNLKIDNEVFIKVKHPQYSSTRQPYICKDCPEKSTCFERACAVRVYADGLVTPCLSGRVSIINDNSYESLKRIYQILSEGAAED